MERREIEVRCRLKNKAKFLQRLWQLDATPLFGSLRGEVLELNLVYKHVRQRGGIVRLRRRVCADGRCKFYYTEKSNNEDKKIRVKSEKEILLSGEEEFRRRLNELEENNKGQRFVYEKRFQAEEHWRYNCTRIEPFEFPYVGRFVEFETFSDQNNISGGKQKLRKVLRHFGFRFKDNIQESTEDMVRVLCCKRGIVYSPVLVFSPDTWDDFASRYAIRFFPPILLERKVQTIS